MVRLLLLPFSVAPARQRAEAARRVGSATLLFVHIPKCAGTSFRRIIKAWYGQKALFSDATAPELARAVGDRAELPRAIAGHLPFGQHHTLPCRPFYVSLVRHPLDRFVSLYKHARAVPDHLFHGPASRLELEPFYDFCLQDRRARGQTMAVQCFYLSGSRAFEDARAVINARYELVAPVECYDRFVERCAEATGKPRLVQPPSNVGLPDAQVDFARAALARRVEQDHRQDLLLHEYVRSRFRD